MVSSLHDPQRSGAAELARYLPHAVVATAFVIFLPAVGVWTLVPSNGPILAIVSVLVAMVLSVAAASAASACWSRRPGSRDVVFADLMLWGWLRRLRAERRLAEARRVLGLSPGDQDLKPVSIHQRVAALKRLSALLEARDPATHGHTRRVTRHAERIARAMHLSPAQVAKVRTAAALHDVGKILTPAEILNKPGQLTEQEFEVIKRHPADGAEMLSGIGDAEITAMVRHHHERLDGAGYPDGLANEQIPVGARIIAVADTFDAMTSNRVYHGATNHKRALDVLSEEAGARLDADAVSAFLSYYSGTRSVAWSALVTAAPQRLMSWLGSASERVGGGVASIAQGLPAAGAAVALAVPMPGGGLAIPLGSPEARQRDAPKQADGSRLTTASTDATETAPIAPRRGERTEPGDRQSPRVRIRRPAGSPDRSGRSKPSGGVAPSAPATAAPSDRTTPTAATEPSAPPSRTPSPRPKPNVPSRPGHPAPTLPDTGRPPANVPPVQLPAVDLPAVQLPTTRLPPVDVPPVVLPEVVLPEVALPGVSVGSPAGGP